MISRLILDFETVDPFLGELGSGWVHGNMDVIGCSYRFLELGTEESWIDLQGNTAESGKAKLATLVSRCDELIAFNSQYDFGLLLMLGIDIRDKILVDVMLLAKLYDNTLLQYNLEYLSQKYLGIGKDTDELARYIYDEGLYKDCLGEHKPTAWLPGNINKFRKYAKTNMDEVYGLNPDLIIKYANTDVNRTYQLLQFYEKELRQW